MSSAHTPGSPPFLLPSHRPRLVAKAIPLLALVLFAAIILHTVVTFRGGPSVFDAGFSKGYITDWSAPEHSRGGPLGQEIRKPWYHGIYRYIGSTGASPSTSTASDSCSWLSRSGVLKYDRKDPLSSTWTSLIQGGCERELMYMKALRESVVPGKEGKRNQIGQAGMDLDDRSDVSRGEENGQVPHAGHGGLTSGLDPFSTDAPPPSTPPAASPSDLTSKRLLLIGDSIERVTFEHLNDLIPSSQHQNGTALTWKTMDEIPKVVPNDPLPPGGHAMSLVFPTTAAPDDQSMDLGSAMRFDFLHYYGLDEVASGDAEPYDPTKAGIWDDKGSHTPGNGPPTLSAKFERMSSIWTEDYDVCVIGSGLWDLARFQRMEYMSRGVDDAVGIPVDWLQTWMEDASRLIRMVRDKYTCRIAWRILHDPRRNAGGWFVPSRLPEGTVKTAPFTPLRIHQLRQAQLELVDREGLDMVPFGLTMLAQGDVWLKDDIHPGAGGSAIYAEMLMEILARGS